jgi:hypothetical protein
MVKVCGGAATTRSPRPRMEMLATQCPRLRRLSGRAAALSLGSPCSVGSRLTFPGSGIPRGDGLLAWGAPAPHPPWPRNPRCGLRPQGGGVGSPNRLRSRPPAPPAPPTPLKPLPQARHALQAVPPSRPTTPTTPTSPTSPTTLQAHHPPGPPPSRPSHPPGPPHRQAHHPPGRPPPNTQAPQATSDPEAPTSRGCLGGPVELSGAVAVIVGRFGAAGRAWSVSVGSWGRNTTRRALDDARGPVSLNQSYLRGWCCGPCGLPPGP